MEKAQEENSKEKGSHGTGKSSFAAFAFGIAVGLVAGLFIAILSAPKTGRESRGIAREAIDSGVNHVRGVLKEATADRKKVYTETWKQPKSKPYSTDWE
jgi:gas vesicle protein